MSTFDEEERYIERLLNDPGFKALDARIEKVSFLHVLDQHENEVIHSRVLAWLLNPEKPHGIGGTFLRRLLGLAATKARDSNLTYEGDAGRPLRPLEVEVVPCHDVRVLTEYCLSADRRLDVLATSLAGRWMLAIENKVNAGEGQNQTSDYFRQLQECLPSTDYHARLHVYLSPTGRKPESSGFIPVSYAEVREVLQRVASDAGLTKIGKVVVDQYLDCLEVNSSMNQAELRRVCWQLRQRHQRALEVIQAYGGGSLLADSIVNALVESLEHDRICDGGLELRWNTASGAKWSALWVDGWPVRKGRYHGYYGIWSEPSAREGEDWVIIKIDFDGEIGLKVRARFAELGGHNGERKFSVRSIDEVESRTREAVQYFRGLIQETWRTLDTALRSEVVGAT